MQIYSGAIYFLILTTYLERIGTIKTTDNVNVYPQAINRIFLR